MSHNRLVLQTYQENRAEWFYDSFPRHFDSLGGRFSNFVFCDGQHRTAFDFGYLDEVLSKSGFDVVEKVQMARADFTQTTSLLLNRTMRHFHSPFTWRLSRKAEFA